MQWTHEYYEQIKHLLPKQRDNVEIDNITFFEAMIHLTENGFRWRAMPEKYGKGNTLYRRFRRWSERRNANLPILGDVFIECDDNIKRIKNKIMRDLLPWDLTNCYLIINNRLTQPESFISKDCILSELPIHSKKFSKYNCGEFFKIFPD